VKPGVIPLLSIGLALALLSGCTSRLVDFTVISSKNIEWNRAHEYQRASHRVEGVDMVHWIIIIPIGVPNAKEALDRAIESVPGAVALLDGVITSKFWWIPYIYGQQSYIVEGTPLIDSKLASAWMHGAYLVTQINRDGTVEETKAVNQQEYTSIRSAVLQE
jgi:hypothetical protein